MFCSIPKEVLLNCIPVSCTKYFTLGKKVPCNALSQELYNPFDFQLITHSIPLFFLTLTH